MQNLAMIISCPACATRYAVPETAIGPEGRTVRCAKCKHSWFQDAQPLELKEETTSRPTAPPPAQTPPPAPAPTPGPAPAASKTPTKQEEPPSPSVDHWAKDADDDEADTRSPAPEEEDEPAEESEESFAGANDPLARTDEEDDDPYFEDADHVFDDAEGEDGEYDDEASSFDYRPPFTRRRNSLKMWTIAAAVFAVLATGTVVAANFYGLPDWVPIQRPEFGIGQTDLELDFPAQQQRKEELESGEEIFQVRGSINNVGQESVSVPSLLIVFRDAREKNVYSWVVVPSKRELAPGESLNVTEAITDIPPTAQAVEIGWSPI